MGLAVGVGLSLGDFISFGVVDGELDGDGLGSLGVVDGELDGDGLVISVEIVGSEGTKNSPKKTNPIMIMAFCQIFRSENLCHKFFSNSVVPYNPVVLTPYSA